MRSNSLSVCLECPELHAECCVDFAIGIREFLEDALHFATRLLAGAMVMSTFVMPMQSDDDYLKAWRDKNRLRTRYEGLVRERAGYPPLEILSFVTDFPASYSSNDILGVVYACRAGERVRLLARELKIWELYRMEAPVDETSCPGPYGSYQDWPAKDVLIRHDVDAKNLGLLAYVGQKPDDLVPARVYVKGASAREVDRYVLWFRADLGLSGATLRVEPAAGGKPRSYEVKRPIPSRDPFKIEIPFRDLIEAEADYNARIDGVLRGRPGETAPSSQFRFRHVPRIIP